LIPFGGPAMKVIVEATYLKKGMYVSELDRPWLETPFLFQGFRITNSEEVEQIQSLCDFVFVDIDKSKVPVTHTMSNTASPNIKPEKQSYIKIFREPMPYSEKFEDEFNRALDCYQLATEEVSTLFEDARMGNSLDVGGARATVTGMVDSILRHPDALVLLTTLGNKDIGLVTHALSVCTLSLAFGRYLGLKNEALVDLGLGALLHDIGKIKVPDQVLDDVVNASEEERALLEGHTKIGAMMLKNLDGLPDNVIAIVHDHHERANGSGYPRKMTCSEIGIHTKIVSIVDTYDSITRGVHGYQSIRVDEALKSMYAWRHELFEELLVEKFIQCVGIYPLGSVVELRTGQIGIVISSCPDARLFPRIMLVLDAHRKPVEPPEMINLTLFREKLDTDDFEVKRLVDGEHYDIDVRQYILRELPLGVCPTID
jgi:putative nucleotidyltransferase with HDIG domain